MMRVLLVVVIIAVASAKAASDFVARVGCEARGMRIRLKEELPPPGAGMWDLEVEDFPDCPAVSKTDVGGGHEFLIPFAERVLCGVDAEYVMTPKRLAQARTILLLKDDNGTIIADSVSCVYNAKFQTSLQTYSGEVRSQNLVYGGSLVEHGSDVESTVASADAVSMDFFAGTGAPLARRNVQLGDPLLLRIAVSKDDQVSEILPEHCYFSSSSNPQEAGLAGPAKTLPFITNNCFNKKDGMVRAFLPRMERVGNGSGYQMSFPAFYFTGHGQNLFVHCTVLACVGADTSLCQPDDGCFESPQRRRKRNVAAEGRSVRPAEVLMTKYIVVQDSRPFPHSPTARHQKAEAVLQSGEEALVSGCASWEWIWALGGLSLLLLLGLLTTAACLGARLGKSERAAEWAEKRLLYASAMSNPAAFHASTFTLSKVPQSTHF